MITCKNDRMLELLWFIGYCVEFPTQLAVRIGGGPEWNRRIMYRAIKQGYVEIFRKKYKRHVIRSLSLTQKGFDYIAVRDPEAVSMIYSRLSGTQKVYPSELDKILRLHAIATGVIMANAGGAQILISQKPSLMSPARRGTASIPPDPKGTYYYTPHEIRTAIEEYSPESVSKSSRTIGIIASGNSCYLLYFTGRTRMYWMKNSEENYAAAVTSLLRARGFSVARTVQVVIGSTMSVAPRLCRSASPFGSKYFVVSTFFSECLYLTNNLDGDKLMRILLDPQLTLSLNRTILAPFQQPQAFMRGYDALDPISGKPVILNYQCDLLKLADYRPALEECKGSPIMYCLDYQAQTIQQIVGPEVEVRAIEGAILDEQAKPENCS